MSGGPLGVVGELLGHKQARTTQRYAHLANHVVRQALASAWFKHRGVAQVA